MAQLKDLIVAGASRFIGDAYANQLQLTSLHAPTAAGSTTYGAGTNGQYLRTNGTSLYWDSPSTDDIASGTLGTARGGTGNNTWTASRLVYSNTATKLASTSITSDGEYLGAVSYLTINEAHQTSYRLKVNGTTGLAAGHLYLTGSQASSSTGNTTQIVFGTNATQHIALSSNAGAFIINPTTSSITGQIVLKPGSASYISTGQLAINSSAQANYNFYVNGTSYHKGLDTHEGNIVPSTINTYNLGSDEAFWASLYSDNLCLNRASNATYGKISFYAPNYTTWINYMSNSTAGAAPTGGTPSTTTEVTSWALRSLIENGSGYGWIWESCANGAASANTVKPIVRMSLSSNTGRLRIEANASTTTNNSGALIVSSELNGSNGNTAIELWRGANASWQIANEGGILHFRNNYTTEKQAAYTETAVSIDYDTNIMHTNAIVPKSSNTYNLGATDLRWSNIYTKRFNQALISGVRTTAGGDKGANSDPRYLPEIWTFDEELTPANGDIITIKTPGPGHDYGVFLSTNNGTNYYPITLNNTKRLTTHYSADSYITLIFDSANSAVSMFALEGQNNTTRVTVSGGTWRVINYYVDGNPGDWNLRQYTIKAQTAVTAVHIIGGTDSGYNMIDAGTAFDIRYVVLYAGSAISAGSTGSNNYIHHYSINIKNSSGSNISLTAYKNIYIKGTISGSTFTPISGGNPYVQDITATDDGYVYYYIGRAYNTSALTFDTTGRDIYIYKNGAIRKWADYAPIRDIADNEEITFTPATIETTTSYLSSWDNNILKAITPLNAIKAGLGTAGTSAQFLRGDYTWSNTLTDSLFISKAGECGLEVDNTQATNPNNVAFIVGASGKGGIYSRTHSKWIVYSDANGDVVLNGNANTATALTSNAGSATQPIYFANGQPVATSHSLSASINSGTANKMAYYSDASTISNAGNLTVYQNYLTSTSRNDTTVDIRINGLLIHGQTYGNTAAEMLSNTVGNFRFGDGGPQIIFNTTATLNAQAGALIFTDHDSAGTGTSFHFVTTENAANGYGGNCTVTAPIFKPRNQIQREGRNVSWYQGRDSAILRQTTYAGYSAILSAKTTNGTWECGTYSSNVLHFSYVTDANYNAGTNTAYTTIRLSPNVGLYGAVWNDYAEMRNVPIANEVNEPDQGQRDVKMAGCCVYEIGDGTMELSFERLQRGCRIISDTFGFNIGEYDNYKTPIAVSGRVLAYCNEPLEIVKQHIGWPVCSGPNGTVSIMTKEEEITYPSRIIGTISEVPDYETWGTGNVKVNGRIWIYVR